MAIDRVANKPPINNVQNNLDQKFKDVAKLYEKQFMREMVKAMRSTIHESNFVPANTAEKIFREQLDDEYVDKWSDRGGVGFADLIYNQLIEKYGSVIGQKVTRPKGPIALTEKGMTSVKFESFRPPGNADQMNLKLMPSHSQWPSSEIVSPWSGVLRRNLNLEDGQKVLEVDHSNGVLGQYVFRGTSSLPIGSEIGAGQTMGEMQADSKAMYWSLRLSGDGLGSTKTPGE